ncbi:protein adenylyltransferase SelO [Allohahella marinimesophila]|uniref:Protein nucleotidyltransferase YdiU n=1 Tax=Allohahella marinimesophila TaxID=1054972 RepID=A0ABP7PL92_9GAMM
MLTTTHFHNRFTDELGGTTLEMRIPQQLADSFYAPCEPEKVPKPRLLAWSNDAAASAGLPSLDDDPELRQTLADIFTGNTLLPGMNPVATVYGGHQFGHWAGQLGDGRAILLGETSGIELQLKGSGRTPFSRGSDGRAVLRSSVREYVCSEAMHHLGVPGTRALSLCSTGAEVVRDMFYDGHPRHETGAIVCRTAPSFLRFGHFEIFAARKQFECLRQLADFSIRHYFPDIHADREQSDSKTTYLRWFEAICHLTMDMIVHWSRVGFVHGVMNTDNMSILGLTIDYGPFGWQEDFDPVFTPNTSDREARYCFGNQPGVARWNLACLANALYPLIEDVPALTKVIEGAEQYLVAAMHSMRLGKLGFSPADQHSLAHSETTALLTDLDALMKTSKMDFTLFFSMLGESDVLEAKLPNPEAQNMLAERLSSAAYKPLDENTLQLWAGWFANYSRIHADLAGKSEEQGEGGRRAAILSSHNPVFIPRNYLLVSAFEALDEGDASILEDLMQASREPYRRFTAIDVYGKRPDWADNYPGAAALSCSS